jgi:hypothetical protein
LRGLVARVGCAGLVDGVGGIVLHGVDGEEPVAVGIGVRDELVPARDVERVVVAEVAIAARDGSVDFEQPVSVDTIQRLTESLRDTRVTTTDGVDAGGDDTASQQAQGVGCLNRIGSLGEGGDAGAVEVAVVRQCVQRWA